MEYGLELLKRGIICRVRNGSSIHIWCDQWIPREVSLSVIGKKQRNSERTYSPVVIKPLGSFMENFMILNIINFTDVTRREKVGVL